MTEVILAKVDHSPEQFEQLRKTTAIVLMAIGLFLSGSLLKWTVSNKLANMETVTESTITAQVRDKQLACLARNIYYEAGSEPFEGKVAVAQVTLNRVASGQFPKDICKTIYQKNVVYEKILCQFSWVCEGKAGGTNNYVYSQAKEIALYVYANYENIKDVTKGALYYHADYVNPRWKLDKTATIGRHIFYKERDGI